MVYLVGDDITTFFTHSHVNDLGEGQMEALTHYLDPENELCARMTVRSFDYKILNVVVDRMRTPLKKVGTRSTTLKELNGQLAYEGVGRFAKESIGEDPGHLALSTVLECIKALRQARLFVWNRLGIDPAEHFDLIKRLLQDSCVFFADPEALNFVLDPDQLREMTRFECLFSRHKVCVVEERDIHTKVESRLSDSYHEMVINLAMEADVITSAKARMLRLPHSNCVDALPMVEGLNGQRLEQGPKAWEQCTSGKEGCAHLSDLARMAWQGVTQSRVIRHKAFSKSNEAG